MKSNALLEMFKIMIGNEKIFEYKHQTENKEHHFYMFGYSDVPENKKFEMKISMSEDFYNKVQKQINKVT